MIETDNSNIPSIILILGPAVITGLASYFIARLQLKIKDKEIVGQSRLKAKTLLFESYEKSFESLTKQSSQLSGTIGKIYASFDSPISDDDETFKTIDSMLRIFRISMDYFRDLLAHALLEVLPNQFGGETDPRQIYVLRWVAGRQAGVSDFNPPYEIS